MSKFMDTIMAACAEMCAACAVACDKCAASAEKSGDAACAQACAACASACRACEAACKGGDMAACASACSACAEACATCESACAEADAKVAETCGECKQACAACASACSAAPADGAEPDVEAMSTDGQEPSKPASPDDANPGAPSALADKPKDEAACADVPAAAPPPPVEGASGTEPNKQPSQGGDPALAAAEECLGLIKQATGLDDAAALAFCRENLDKIAALAKGGSSAPLSEGTTAQLTRTLGVAEGQIAALTRRVAEYEAKDASLRADAEKAKRVAAEATVEQLITCGRALDVQRESLVTAALETPAWFAKHVATMPQVVPTDRIAATQDSLDKSGGEDLGGADETWLNAFDVQLRSTIPNAKDRRALAVKAFREKMEVAGIGAKTNGRA